MKERQPKHSDAESSGESDRGLKAFNSTLRFPGAVILRNEGAHGLHEGEWDEHDEGADLFSNTNACRGDEAKCVYNGQDYEKREPDQQILQRDGCSEAHNSGQNGRLNPDILAREREGQSPAAQDEERNEYADRLGGDCRKRSSCGTHMKTRDQKKIPRYVADTCDRNGDQRRVGVAQSAHDTSQDVIGDDHQRTGAADRDIPARLFKGFFRRVHERCQLPGKQGNQKGQRKTCGKKENDTGSDDPAAEFFVAFTKFLPEQNCRAHGERTDEPCHSVHDLRADSDAGDILRQREFSYDHKVDGTVKCLQKQCEQYRH